MKNILINDVLAVYEAIDNNGGCHAKDAKLMVVADYNTGEEIYSAEGTTSLCPHSVATWAGMTEEERVQALDEFDTFHDKHGDELSALFATKTDEALAKMVEIAKAYSVQ